MPREVTMPLPNEPHTNPFLPSSPTSSTPHEPPYTPKTLQSAPATPKPHPELPNTTAEEAKKLYFDKAREFGKKDGAGKVSFVAFARSLVDGGMENTLSASTQSKDAEQLYDAFIEASRKEAKNIQGGELTQRTRGVQVSKVRAFIRFGNLYQEKAANFFENVRKLHGKLVELNDEGLKYRSTYTALLSIITEQNAPDKQDTAQGVVKIKKPLMTDEEVKDILLLPAVAEKAPTTGVGLLINAMTLIDSAMRGRAKPNQDSKVVERAPVTHDDLPTVLSELERIVTEVDEHGELKLHRRKLAEAKDLKEAKSKIAAAKAKAKEEKKAKANAALSSPATTEDENEQETTTEHGEDDDAELDRIMAEAELDKE